LGFVSTRISQEYLGEWISNQNLRQFRIAETEKYAHVTYFFNGGQEQTFPGEERLVIPSLGLTNYASNPEMSLDEVTASLERVLDKQEHDFIVCNLANGDMVGHSGDLAAGIEAIKKVDEALMKIIPACERNSYVAVITADHGNIEKMKEKDAPQLLLLSCCALVITDNSLSLQKKVVFAKWRNNFDVYGCRKTRKWTGEALF
jgi:2,3-bisphosphoglycerate-independent phosphoglycerate mutase